MRARLVIAAVAVGMLWAFPGAAEAQQEGSGTTATEGTLTIGATVDRFAVRSRRIVGRGTLTARLVDNQGNVQSARRPVTFGVTAQRASCSILTLKLEDLQLTLLGVHVDTSSVNLLLYGIERGRNGGVLGRLFCALADSTIRLRAQVRAGRHERRVVRSLNSRLKRKPLRAFGATAKLSADGAQTAQQAPSCRVLNLVLGPLDLNLLGLVVELYGPSRNLPVTLTITAFPGQGALGDLFCQLSGGPR
jgi:hypothetical protein